MNVSKPTLKVYMHILKKNKSMQYFDHLLSMLHELVQH